MAMDKSDSRLMNGAIIAAVLFGVVYFWPAGWLGMSGFRELSDQESAARASLHTTNENGYVQHYAPLQPVNYGEHSDPIPPTGDVAPIAGLKKLYDQANDFTKRNIQLAKKANRMVFPYWTDIPEGERIPGSYFRLMWDDKKYKTAQRCLTAKVELDDSDIGFKKLTGILPDEPKAKEYLRELYITEKLIDLCIQAKLAEDQRARDEGRAPDAYMHIMEIEPKPSEPTGPTALEHNPKFDPHELNPGSIKFRKYIVTQWPSFIQEYPVKIQLMCDTHTFIQFLHSVRTKKDPDARFEFRGIETRKEDGQTYAHLRVIDEELNKRAKDGKEMGGINPRWIEDELNIEVKAGDYLPECKCTVLKINSHEVSLSDEARREIVVSEGQFLVLRQLEILSPSFDDSKSDKTEEHPFKSDTLDPAAKRRWPDKKDQVVVTISAAGMDFFDPVKEPGGLYKKNAEEIKPKVRPGGRILSAPRKQ